MGTDPVVEGGEDLATDLRHETTIGDRPYQTPPSVADRPWTPMMGTDLVVEGGEDSATDLRRPLGWGLPSCWEVPKVCFAVRDRPLLECWICWTPLVEISVGDRPH
jgi:hypothetical protein